MRRGAVTLMGISNPSGSSVNISTGSYAGDDTDNRQITVGFTCKGAIVMAAHANAFRATICETISHTDKAAGDNVYNTDIAVHGSDGFIVDTTTYQLNTSGITYHYIAWG